MAILDDVIARVRSAAISFRGDEPLMAAAVSAAALIITADGEIAEEEVETALADLVSEPTLHANYLPSALALELRRAIERACSVAGRGDNLAMVSAIAHRPEDERTNVFLVAVDVAMAHQGVVESEDQVLSELARRLLVDKAILTAAAETQRLVTGEGVDLSRLT